MRSLHDATGVITEILPGDKCAVVFQVYGKTHTGVLPGNRLIVSGVRALTRPGTSISKVVSAGSKIRFSCHEFESKPDHEYGWYITSAWLISNNDLVRRTPNTFLGMYSCAGKIQHVTKRSGVISYVDDSDVEHTVWFLASKVVLFGKRVSTKQALSSLMSIDDSVLFDAVPCTPEENIYNCKWFATIVWRGPKPTFDYDSAFDFAYISNASILDHYKAIVTNPKSLFCREEGQVLKIINEEYGVALMQVKKNRWDSVIFHRSVCFLFQLSLSEKSLKEVFEEGDKLRIIASPAPKSMITQWVAVQVSVAQGPLDV